MPRPFQPPSLRKVCLRSIASNYDYWCAGQSPSQTDFISHFQDLQDDMIETLIVNLHKRDIRFLFHPNIRRITIRCLDDISCIQLLSTRCQKLTHLGLHNTMVQPAVLCHLVSGLTELVSLDLRSTKTDRSVLKAIADNCPKLHDLNVEGCSDLKNTDFLPLCNQPESPRISLQLTNLILPRWMKGLTVNTVVSLLNSHPKLKSLGECELIDQALCQMYGTAYQDKKEVPQRWIHNLSKVTFVCRRDRILDLELTTRCCPHLTKLTLRLANGYVHSLRAASNLKSLKSLSILGVYWGSLSNMFQTDVVSILEKIGGNLTSLSFKDMNDVCVFLIGEFCPNLQSLILSVGFRSSTYNQTTDQHFRHLQVLEISNRYSENTTICTEVLSVILLNASELNEMKFDSVLDLTDSIISKADKKHGFCFLAMACFEACRLITKETGMILLSPDNPLKRLYFKYCQNITSQEEYIFKQYAKHSQVTIDVEDIPDI